MDKNKDFIKEIEAILKQDGFKKSSTFRYVKCVNSEYVFFINRIYRESQQYLDYEFFVFPLCVPTDNDLSAKPGDRLASMYFEAEEYSKWNLEEDGRIRIMDAVRTALIPFFQAVNSHYEIIDLYNIKRYTQATEAFNHYALAFLKARVLDLDGALKHIELALPDFQKYSVERASRNIKLYTYTVEIDSLIRLREVIRINTNEAVLDFLDNIRKENIAKWKLEKFCG